MKRTIKILLGIIIGLAMIVFVVLLLLINRKDNQYEKYLSLGDKYLKEMNYEDAIVAYTEAINIMPNSEDAYIQLSDVYVENQDYQNARKVLEDYEVRLPEIPEEEQAQEAISQQQERIAQKEEVDINAPKEEESVAKGKEGNKKTDVIAIAEQTLGMEYCGGKQFERSFEKTVGAYGETVIISPIDKNNIISAVNKDFDGDGKDEILVIVRNYHAKPVDVFYYNTFSFCMLEKTEKSWIRQDQVELIGDHELGAYNVGSVPKELDFFLKEIDGSLNIYYEGHQLAQYFADGYGWELFWYSYENNRFIKKSEPVSTGGSDIDPFLYMDPEMAAFNEEYRKDVQEFKENVEKTGVNIDKIDMEYPIMDVDSDTIKICSIECTAQFDSQEIMVWRNDASSKEISGITEIVTDYANQKNTQKNIEYKKIYKSFLETSDKMYFVLIDIDTSGVPELIISEDKNCHNGEVYTVENGNVKFVDSITNKNITDGVRYNPSASGLVLANGGSGSVGESLWQMSEVGMLESHAVLFINDSEPTYQYNYVDCTEEEYNKYYNEYFAENKVEYSKMMENTNPNRNAVLS